MNPLLHHRLLNEDTDGTPLVLIHGLFGAGDNLMGIARGFTDRPVVLVDLRNHGRSFHAATMSFDEMAEDVAQVIESLGWPQADVVGHSLGGKVAIQLAQLRPSVVRRLVVADIAPIAYPPHHQSVLAGLQAIDVSAVISRRQADEVLAEYVIEAGVRNFLLTNLVRAPEGGYAWRMNLPGLIASYEVIRSAPAFVGGYAGPTLYVRGELSDYIQPASEEAINRYTPAATIQTLAGCGHWLHAEKPADFNQSVRAFIES